MGFRFRRTIGLLPGVRLNLSKGLPSVSLGRRGIRYTIGAKGNRFTVGLPGTGLSYTDYEPHRTGDSAAEPPGEAAGRAGRRHTPLFGFVLFVLLLAAYWAWTAYGPGAAHTGTGTVHHRPLD